MSLNLKNLNIKLILKGLVYYILPQILLLSLFTILGVEFVIKRMEPFTALDILSKSHEIMFFIFNLLGACVYGIFSKERDLKIIRDTIISVFIFLSLNFLSSKSISSILILILAPTLMFIMRKRINSKALENKE